MSSKISITSCKYGLILFQTAQELAVDDAESYKTHECSLLTKQSSNCFFKTDIFHKQTPPPPLVPAAPWWNFESNIKTFICAYDLYWLRISLFDKISRQGWLKFQPNHPPAPWHGRLLFPSLRRSLPPSLLLSSRVNISGAYLRFSRCVRTLKPTSSLGGIAAGACVCVRASVALMRASSERTPDAFATSAPRMRFRWWRC